MHVPRLPSSSTKRYYLCSQQFRACYRYFNASLYVKYHFQAFPLRSGTSLRLIIAVVLLLLLLLVLQTVIGCLPRLQKHA